MRCRPIQSILGMESSKLENQERVLGYDVLEDSEYDVLPENRWLDERGSVV